MSYCVITVFVTIEIMNEALLTQSQAVWLIIDAVEANRVENLCIYILCKVSLVAAVEYLHYKG